MSPGKCTWERAQWGRGEGTGVSSPEVRQGGGQEVLWVLQHFLVAAGESTRSRECEEEEIAENHCAFTPATSALRCSVCRRNFVELPCRRKQVKPSVVATAKERILEWSCASERGRKVDLLLCKYLLLFYCSLHKQINTQIFISIGNKLNSPSRVSFVHDR